MSTKLRWAEYWPVCAGVLALHLLVMVVGGVFGGGGSEISAGARVAGWFVEPAQADSHDGADTPDGSVPKAILDIEGAGGRAVPLGETEGLRAFLVVPPEGRAYTLYALASGSVVIGLLLGPDGTNLTAGQLRDAHEAGKLDGLDGLAVSPAVAEVVRDQSYPLSIPELFEATRVAAGFWIGERGPEFHVFVDPTCPYSVEHVRLLARDAAAGKLRAHVIPVGVLGARGVQRAVAVVGDDDPRAAWEGRQGGTFDPAAGAAKVAANTTLHGAWRVPGVPFTVWMGAREVRVFYGAGAASSFAGEVLGGS